MIFVSCSIEYVHPCSYSAPPFSHLNSCTSTNSNLYLADSLDTVASDLCYVSVNNTCTYSILWQIVWLTCLQILRTVCSWYPYLSLGQLYDLLQQNAPCSTHKHSKFSVILSQFLANNKGSSITITSGVRM